MCMPIHEQAPAAAGPRPALVRYDAPSSCSPAPPHACACTQSLHSYLARHKAVPAAVAQSPTGGADRSWASWSYLVRLAGRVPGAPSCRQQKRCACLVSGQALPLGQL